MLRKGRRGGVALTSFIASKTKKLENGCDGAIAHARTGRIKQWNELKRELGFQHKGSQYQTFGLLSSFLLLLDLWSPPLLVLFLARG